jgi:hypothetical protein
MAFSPLTIAAALAAARTITGPYDLVGSSPEQLDLVRALPAYTGALREYAAYTKGFAAPTAAEINAQLARAGFDIRLSAWPEGAGNFGIAGITDVTVNWYKPGEPKVLQARSGGRYPGFVLGTGEGARVVKTDVFPEPIVEIYTLENLLVRIVMTTPPDSQLDLMRTCRSLHEAMSLPEGIVGYAAHLPMVKLLTRPDISWLVGLILRVPGSPGWHVREAQQEVRFAMNQFGARAKEATAFGLRMMSISTEVPYVINEPFLITISSSDQAAVPLFGAYIGTDAWADPGNLSAL